MNQFNFRSLNISCHHLQEKRKKIRNDENDRPGKRQRKEVQVEDELEKISDDVDDSDEDFEPLKSVKFSINPCYTI